MFLYLIIFLLVTVQIILIIAQYKNFFPSKPKENEEKVILKPEEEANYIEGILTKIDKKITNLENLIISADEKINELKKLQNSQIFSFDLNNKNKNISNVSSNNNSKREKVINLKNKGCDIKEIVKITGLSRPEVELILNLFKQGVQ